MTQRKSDEAYTQRLTKCATLAELRQLVTLYSDLALDAERIVTTMNEQDFKEFRRGLKSERKGRFAGEISQTRFRRRSTHGYSGGSEHFPPTSPKRRLFGLRVSTTVDQNLMDSWAALALVRERAEGV